jgi:hypothetical protein
MVESHEPANADAQPPKLQERKKIGRTIGFVLGALVILAAMGAAVYGMVTHPSVTATVRDITIILLALSTSLIGLALIILVLQLQSLIALLRDEVRPILDSANQTARTVRGTTAFLSDSFVKPVISVASYASGVRQALAVLAGGRKRSSTHDAGRTKGSA